MNAFISYHNVDVESARYVRGELEKRGHVVTLVERTLEAPHKELIEKLRASDLVLAVVGHETARREWVAAEVFVAHAEEKRIVCVLVDEACRPPTTVPPSTVVLFLSDLRRDEFKQFDIFPSRATAKRKLLEARVMVGVHTDPRKQSLEPPVINDRSPLVLASRGLANVAVALGYLLGFFLPNIIYLATYYRGGPVLADGKHTSIHIWLLLGWQVLFWFILFSNPDRRLAYPMWLLWLFRDWIPAQLSTTRRGMEFRLNHAMEQLRESDANRQFWEKETALRQKGD